jgi:excisionase family DNA binding protein
MNSHTLSHMSPAQAAQVAGVSRWTIMRAIKSHHLSAYRDNKNQWKISQEALDDWRSHTVRTQDDEHTVHSQTDYEIMRQKLSEQAARADVAEALLARERELNASLAADRDHWRQQAHSLTQRTWFWPFKK